MPNPTDAYIDKQLANMCQTLRRTPMPIADVIPLLQRAADRILELERIAYEAYQVVGVLSDYAPPELDDQIVKIMDNLSAASLVHDDILPFGQKD